MITLHHFLSVIIFTHNRIGELARTLEHLLALAESPAIVVVDNASTDLTPIVVAQHFPSVRVITLARNIGAAARNIGVEQVQTLYVAFSDDDSWWEQGSLVMEVRIREDYQRVAALCARILLGAEQREDPVCKTMASCPLPSNGLPGPALLGFIACAVVYRRRAYIDARGYQEKFFVGGEEELLTLDLVSAGWNVVYMPQLVVHHYPSPQRDNIGRQKIVIRNALWVAWLRLPLAAALKQTWRISRSASNRQVLHAALLNALSELPWICRERKVLPPNFEALYRRLRILGPPRSYEDMRQRAIIAVLRARNQRARTLPLVTASHRHVPRRRACHIAASASPAPSITALVAIGWVTALV